MNALINPSLLPELPPELANHPDYRIERELGRGGMGVVYLAHNALMGRHEVLKVMGQHLASKPKVVERFVREIQAVARLKHDNIVSAYSAMRMGGSIVFAMEYVEGMDLAKLVKAKGPLPVPHACRFIQQAALGLQHAHEKGMVHRDIKPGNLMLAKANGKLVVKVLDFGLAKASAEVPVEGGLTNEGQMLGTPDYIAPEQIRDAQSADVRADIYSLGCTLYYLLTGGPPFRSEKLWDLYQAHFSRDADPLNQVRPEVPAELAALVGKMMAKEPSDRFQTPGEVAEALRPYFQKAGARKVTVGQPGSGSVSGSWDEIRASGPVTPVPTPATGSPEANWVSLINVKTEELTPRSALSVGAKSGTGGSSRTSGPHWGLPALAGAGVLPVGLMVAWLFGAFSVKTTNGSIVFKHLPDQAVVKVDGNACTVEWSVGEGRRHARVTLPTGKHYVQVEVDGQKVSGKKVDIEAGRDLPFSIGSGAPVATRRDRLTVKREDGSSPSITRESSLTVAESPSDRQVPFDPTRFDIYGGRWVVEGNELIQADGQANGPAIMFGDPNWTDYDFTADLMRVEGDTDGMLIFRGADRAHNIYFASSAFYGRKSQFILILPQNKVRNLGMVPCPFTSGKWYTASSGTGRRVSCHTSRPFDRTGAAGCQGLHLYHWPGGPADVAWGVPFPEHQGHRA